jgi:hypothetical protein
MRHEDSFSTGDISRSLPHTRLTDQSMSERTLLIIYDILRGLKRVRMIIAQTKALTVGLRKRPARTEGKRFHKASSEPQNSAQSVPDTHWPMRRFVSRLASLPDPASHQVVIRTLVNTVDPRDQLAQHDEKQRHKAVPGSETETPSLPDAHRQMRCFVSRLASLPNPASHQAVMRALVETSLVSERELDKYLTMIFSQRQTHQLEEMLNDKNLESPDVRAVHHLKLFNYQGRHSPLIDNIAETYFKIPASHFLKLEMLQHLLSHSIDIRRSDIVDRLVKTIDPDAFCALPDSTFISLLRFLASEKQYNTAHRILAQAGLSDDDRLFILEELHALNALSSAPQWRNVLTNFERSYTFADKEDVQEFLVDRLRAIPPGAGDLLNIRFSSEERERISELFRDRLMKREPLSLIRLGGGEAYAFSRPPLKFADASIFDEDDEYRERHWWGVNIPPEIRAALRAGIRQAIAQSDMLGIPSIYRILRYKGRTGQPFSNRRTMRGIMTVLAQLGDEIPISGKIFTEERCHHLLFSRSFLAELAAFARNLVIVGCWDEGKLGDFGRPATFIRVAPAQRADVAVGEHSLPPLWRNYEEVCASVSAASAPGSLVLVGGGVIGKLIINRARSVGAVALDVGAVLDSFAGYNTRSASDTIQLALD